MLIKCWSGKNLGKKEFVQRYVGQIKMLVERCLETIKEKITRRTTGAKQVFASNNKFQIKRIRSQVTYR